MNKYITFVYSLKTSFVEKDLATLKLLGYTILEIQSKPHRAFFPFLWNRKMELIKSLFFVCRSMAVIVWFNDYHAFFPLLIARLFRKKSLVIVGGYDAIKDTELHYGIFLKNGLRQTLARWNYILTKQIWVVHKSLAEGCPTAFTLNNTQSGIRVFMPNLKTPIVEVPTGYDPDFWKLERPKQPKTILTVANIGDKRTFQRKGLPLFIALAKRLPDFKFTIVGATFMANKTNTLPPNLTVLGKQPPEALKALYNTHYYYFQGSKIEGLPNVLCEAMLCECVPIGNAVFGIPDAIGETGMLFQGISDMEDIVSFLEKPQTNIPNNARKRIIQRYHQELRTNYFINILET